MGLIADIAGIMKNLEENGERATPEMVFALTVRKEGGRADGNNKGHGQGESAEPA